MGKEPGASNISVGGRSSARKKSQKKSYGDIIAELTIEVKRLMAEWQELKNLLLKSFLGKDTTDEEERKFLDMKSRLTRLSRNLDSRTPAYLDVGSSEVQKIVKTGVNLQVLSKLPTITKKGLYGKWHVAYMQMHRTLGALEFFAEGYRPPKKKKKKNAISAFADQMTGMFGTRVEDEEKQENPVKTLVIVIAGVAIAIFLIWMAFNISI